MSVCDLLSVLYETLSKLFEDFDPARYGGERPLTDHFVDMFAGRIKRALARRARPKSDKGKKGDKNRFVGRPELGLFNGTSDRTSLQNEWMRQKVHEALRHLPEAQHQVIKGKYFLEQSYREIARELGFDHKTVRKRHDDAIDRLRDEVA
jgi:RNA polymerase sigma factor (sigma-70 family)